MALRKKGNIWYSYFRDENGKLHTYSTGCRSKEDAQMSDDANLTRVRAIRSYRLSLKHSGKEYAEKAKKNTELESLPPVVQTAHKRGTMALSEMFDCACKYRTLSDTHLKSWNRFVSGVDFKFADQITPAVALKYLQDHYGKGNGKSYNNNKTYLNTIFKLCLIESGLDRSPFESLVNMRLKNVQNHRPITSDEFHRLFDAAKEPWKTAIMISWYTGLRESDCFRLRWEDIQNDAIVLIPQKTSRFNRSVYIPIHDNLRSWFETLPHPSEDGKTILSVFIPKEYKRLGGRLMREINSLFVECNVNDTNEGKASFHSIRASFVTRCDAAGIPRSAIRSIVGHTEDSTTDMYSQDKETPKMILKLD